jgi:diacylglycerol kinase
MKILSGSKTKYSLNKSITFTPFMKCAYMFILCSWMFMYLVHYYYTHICMYSYIFKVSLTELFNSASELFLAMETHFSLDWTDVMPLL